MVTRGSTPNLSLLETSQANRVIYAFPAPVIEDRIWQKGVRLKLQDLPFTERGSAAKTGNYMRSIRSIEDAKQEGFDDILQVNSTGEITEASTANIFLIGRHGDSVEIATPAAKSGLLLGITRETITELLEKSQIAVTKRVILADEIPRFDEAFICSTVRGLVPVACIDDHRLHSARDKAVFQHIRRLHHTWAETQIGFRVDWNTAEPIADGSSGRTLN
jgi:branched-subunit amino acid aminotransferase/4-amino-4-deoxychorismate lyase